MNNTPRKEPGGSETSAHSPEGHAFDAKGSVIMGDKCCGKSEATRQLIDAARARGEDTYEVKRACDRREREMCAHGMEEKTLAAYWKDKYHEGKRLWAMQEKVAVGQTAALQRELENARDDKRHDMDLIRKLEAQLEGARARAFQEAADAVLNIHKK